MYPLIKEKLLSHKNNIYAFLLFSLLFVTLSCIIRLFASSTVDISEHKRILAYTTICTGLTLSIWNYEKKVIFSFFFFSVLYTATAFIKLVLRLPLAGREIADAFCFGNLVCCLIILLLRFVVSIKSSNLKKVSRLLLDLAIVGALILPVSIIGYYILSKEILTTTIILTLFQTNIEEVISYLKDKDSLLWGLTFLLTFILIGTILRFFNNIHKEFCNKPFTIFSILLFLVTALLVGFKLFPKLTDCYAVNIVKQTTLVLKEYKDYGKAKEFRKQNLQKLKGLSVIPDKGGLYILVIGESETRDHMHVYGYNKDNTPFLTQMCNGGQTGVVLFKNAYSNHTHTVPVLTYALSTKNQYNQINLKTAYSIVEVAKAAGYKTYWISNQLKYGAWDTPTAEIASTADYEIWLNGSVGKTTDTQFYDEKIIEKTEEIKTSESKNVFVICHLMGCHFHYGDRYPKSFEKYPVLQDSSDKDIATYDNCVYYNDYVLKTLYETAKKMPNFKGFIYLSDHGEDPDNKKSHEASKFTWQMAHIPFIMLFSDSFIEHSENTFQALVQNKDKYWTNDLLYNVLVSILGIQNAPECTTEYLDISSGKYNMNRNNLKTLHGKKLLKEDKL